MEGAIRRAATVGGLMGIPATVALWLALVTAPVGGVVPWPVLAVLAMVVGAIATCVAGSISIVFMKYPWSAFRGAVLSSVASTGICGLGVYYRPASEPIPWAGVAVTWAILWPLGFGLSLLFEVALAIVNKMSNRA